MTHATPQPKGQLVCVVGPSGAGKDSVLNWLVAHWAHTTPLQRARRTITRPAHAGGEPHEAMDVAPFEHLRNAGGFAWHWTAHGLHYGIRHTELKGLAQGACVLLNGSRAHLDAATARFPGVAVLHITASPATLHSRLQARQRESASDIQQRVHRQAPLVTAMHTPVHTVHNDGALADAGQQALDWLSLLLKTRHTS